MKVEALLVALSMMTAPLVVLAESPKEEGLNTCKTEAPRQLSVKDPDIVARKYFVAINGKNSFGAYAGEKIYECYTSEDGKRLLDLK